MTSTRDGNNPNISTDLPTCDYCGEEIEDGERAGGCIMCGRCIHGECRCANLLP